MEKGLYRGDAQAVFVVEGAFDALAIAEVGGEALALNSTSNVGKLIQQLEKRTTNKTLILCLDNDAGGNKATEPLEAGLKRLNIPFVTADICLGHKDPNEALTADRAAFQGAVEDAQSTIAQPDDVFVYVRQSMMNEVDEFSQQKLQTGYPNLDERAGSLYGGLYIIAAVSSLGKTTFVHQMADQIAASGNDVIYFSLEQSRLELVSKSLSRITAQNDMESAITSLSIRRGHSRQQVQDVAEQYIHAVQHHLSIVEGNFNCNLTFIGNYVRQYIRKNNGVKPIIVIDYLQILQGESSEYGRQSAKEMMDNTVTALKRLSRECGITIIAVSSVNRQNYLTPIDFESLKESGGIEYTADVIWGLQLRCLDTDPTFDRPNDIKTKRQVIREAKAANPREIELICLKNRYGISSFNCYFDYYPAYDLFVPAVDDSSAGLIGKRTGRILR